MLKFLVRCVLFMVGVVMLLDIGLPTRVEQLQVDQHTSQTQNDFRATRSGDSRWADTGYKVHLIGGAVSSCSVGYTSYALLKDGDGVEVQSTRLFKTCIRITREAEVVEANPHWKWYALAIGGLLIALALGWLKSDDDDGDGIRIRL